MFTSSRNVTNVLPIASLLLTSLVSGSPGIANAATSACTVSGNSLSDAKQQFEQSCPGRIRADCDPSGNIWQCSTENLPIPTGLTPTTPSSPSTPTGNEAVLLVQAESPSNTIGSGWSTESSIAGYQGPGYIVWRGNDDFRTSDNEPPAGINTYNFVIEQAGTYEFTARVQARVGNGSAANDKDNDAWVKFTSGSTPAGVRGDAAKWTKFFVSGADENWKNYNNGEQYDPTFFTAIQRNLTAGTHRILIGGRSARFAIDNIGLTLISATDGTGNKPDVEPDVPSLPTDPNPSTPTDADSCSAQGPSLAQARTNYANSCPTLARKDCDPIGDGNWLCSSENIGSNAPTQTPTTPEPTEPATTPTTPTTPTASGECSAQGSSLSQAKSNYEMSCPTIARADCDPIGGGSWLCSSEKIGSNAGTPASTPDPVSPGPVTPDPGTTGLISDNDLLALHYDNCPDRDDGHAVVAGKAVVDKLGLQNIIVVNGTCGAAIDFRYQPGSVDVLQAVYGNNWLDSQAQESASISASADRWAATLANGDDVWVAEGGPSDFTADVLRRIATIYPSVNTKRIRVVQHSAGGGFNESNTSAAGIALVKRATDYIAIPNGNIANNGSAGLNQKSTYFLSVASQSRYAQEWEAAFDYLSPSSKLDFSDTVELLYMIGDSRTQTVDDFANYYLK